MATLFETSQSPFILEAHRRAIMTDIGRTGMPMDDAAAVVDALWVGGDPSAAPDRLDLLAYPDLYADLWCDPRINAPPAVRRVLLAMVTRLYQLGQTSAVPDRGHPPGAGPQSPASSIS
ncbi:MAG: hypothetical protein V4472_10670 [Pseudomonadota bacterium]